jgi:MFS transporter, DHA2 family, multidrug resistance protein
MSTTFSGLPQPQRRWAIVAISLGTALVVIDNSIATIALPTIARDLGVAPSSIVSVVTVYQLVLLMALLPFSALGDLIGHKRLYQGGQTLFIVATLLCVFASNLPMLLAARAGQAVGVACVLSVSAALLRRIYPSDRLGRGLGLNSVIIASAGALAPTIGGLILSLGSWRWVFAAAAPFAVLSLLLGRGLPDPPPSRTAYDLPGAVLCAAMFGALIGGLEIQVHHGWSVGGLALIGAGAIVAWLFVKREWRRPTPILPVDLLARPIFALSSAGALMTFAGAMSFTLSLPFRFHAAYGLSPVEIGALMAAWPLTMMAVAPIAGALSDRTPKGLLSAIGMLLAAVGFLIMAFPPAEWPGYAPLAAPLMLSGAGLGLFISPNSHLIMRSAPPERSASAGALISTTRLIGSALGATLFALLLALQLGGGPAPAFASAACAMTSALCSLANLLLGGKPGDTAKEPDRASQ